MLAVRGLAMHIPDGFLSVLVSIFFWILSVLLISLVLRRVGSDLGERQVPLMGVLAAAIFAAQILNFTVVGGTSGHLLGAALAAILVGPWAAVVVLSCVVAVQALLFQDGGLLVLGANLFNMAIVSVAVAHMVYRSILKLSGGRRWGIFAGSFLAAWASIFLSALSAGLQLALSGTSPANIAIPTMGGIHALIGTGEGLITLGALAFLGSVRPDLLQTDPATSSGARAIWLGGLLISLVLAVVSPLASRYPDGLEWVAQQQGFLHLQREPLYRLVPEYLLPGIADRNLATVLAAVIGVAVLLGASWAAASSRRRGPQGMD